MTTVRIFSGTHRCEVIASDVGEVTVDGKADVDQTTEFITVDAVRSRLSVRVPTGSDIVVGSSTGRIELSGRFGTVSASSETGKVLVDEASTLDARTSSSRIEVGRVDGSCRIHTATGRVDVGSCGAADIASETSRIELRSVNGRARAHTVSGRVTVTMDTAADVDAETVTGRVTVSLPKGTRFHRPRPGSSGDRPSDMDCTVRARSMTGKVEVSTR